MVDQQVTYEHSAVSGTIAFKTNNLRIRRIFLNKGTDIHEDGTIKAFDANRYQRIFTLTATMSGAEYKAFDDLMSPGAGSEPDYTTAYPRLTKVFYTNALSWSNVEVICTILDAVMSGRLDGDQAWAVLLEFKEKTS